MLVFFRIFAANVTLSNTDNYPQYNSLCCQIYFKKVTIKKAESTYKTNVFIMLLMVKCTAVRHHQPDQ